MIFGFLLISLVLPLAALAAQHPRPHLNRHNDLAKRASGDVHIYKRFSSARWSFYDVGLGACGQYNVESDFIVALNTDQYGSGYPGPNCFKTITMSYGGKTTTATIMDQCPGCPYGGLDLSRGLFKFFAAESVGIIYGEWSFSDSSGDSASTTYVEAITSTTKKTTTKATTSQSTPTTTWTPEPTSTWVPDPTTSSTKKTKTSTWVEPSSTTSSVEPTSSTVASSTSISISASASTTVLSSSAAHSSSSVSSSAGFIASSVNFSSGAASGLAAPTGTIVSGENDPNNINSINNLFINLGGLVTGAAKAD
ncbi:RlpA-like double-psi beta-barrel-protein domain-containing protein-containing protein [Cyathus striatus]|nr:RlpA-like double-psi beta-barrel-protein domain-containing protein-containing protein [Cyathus striatus]